MYYAYGMKRHASNQPKKQSSQKKIILAVVLPVAALLVAGAYFYGPQLLSQFDGHTDNDPARETVNRLNIKGDEALSIEYTRLMMDDKPDDAKRLFTDRIAAESDDDKKIILIEQWTALAKLNQSEDHALEGAQLAIATKPTHAAASELATVYDLRGEQAAAIEAINRALELVAEVSDEQMRDQLIEQYELQKMIYETRVGQTTEIISDREQFSRER